MINLTEMKAFRHEKWEREREKSGTKADFHVNDSSFCSEPLYSMRMFLRTGKRRTLTFGCEFVSSQGWRVPLHSVESWRNQHHVWSELIRNRHHHRPLKKTKTTPHKFQKGIVQPKKWKSLFIHHNFFPTLYYLFSSVEIFTEHFCPSGHWK